MSSETAAEVTGASDVDGTSTDQLVRLEQRGPAAVVTLNRPDKRNALSRALLQQLHAALTEAISTPDARVVVLTGSGRVFCSGADLAEASSGGGASKGPGMPEVLQLLHDSPRPTVARVNGSARAGGLGLIAACDLTVGLASASFGFSEVRIGVVPALISVTCLRRMDPRAARELFLTGEVFDGGRAVTAGLLDRAVADDALDVSVDTLVASLAKGAPEALALTKEVLRSVPGASMSEDLEAMNRLSMERFGSDEAREGITAMLEKRPPSWEDAVGAR